MAETTASKVLRTIVLYMSFFAMGAIIAIPGPTLLDLQCQVEADAQQITPIYSARSLGYILGAMIGGFIFSHQNKQAALTLCLFFTAISVGFVPWSWSIIGLFVAMFFVGIFTGAMDTGGNVYILEIWGKKSDPFLQALHFTFGIGALIAPLIAEPFLTPLSSDFPEHNNTLPMDCIKPNKTNASSPFELEFYQNMYVQFPYLILALYTLLVTVFSLVVFLALKAPTLPQTEFSAIEKQKKSTSQNLIFYIFAVLTVTFIFFYCGLEVVFGQLLATYAVTGNLKLSKSAASYLTSCFWGTYTFGRGISIFIATKVSPYKMLVCNLGIVVLGGVVLVTLGSSHLEALWIGTALLGFGVAPNFASTLSFFEKYFKVGSKVTSGFVIGASMGEMVLPLFVGQFIATYPFTLLYVTLAIGVTCSFLFVFMNLISRRIKTETAQDSIELSKM